MGRATSTSVAAVLALVSATILAGCTSPPRPLELDSVIDYLERPKGFTWPDPVVTDAEGAPLPDHGLAKDPAVGYLIHRMVSKESSNPDLDFTESAVLVSAFEKVHRSTDRGQNWTNVTNFRTDAFPNREDRSYTIATVFTVDDETNRALMYSWTFGIHEPSPNLLVCRSTNVGCNVGSCPSLYYSDDGGDVWRPAGVPPPNPDSPHMGHNPESCVSPESGYGFTILPKILTAPMADSPLPPLTPNRWVDRVLYVCQAFFTPKVLGEPHNAPYCSVSFDGGATYERTFLLPEPIVEDVLDPCYIENVGRGAYASDGAVIFPVFRVTPPPQSRPCEPGVVVTRDNGLTWSYTVGPSGGENRRNMDIEPQVALGEDGTAYLVYRSDDNFAPYLYRSKPGKLFLSEDDWEGPFRIAPADHEINSHLSVVAGAGGRVAVGYYGTHDAQDRSLFKRVHPAVADPNTVWHAYVTQSYNAADEWPVFVTTQVTPNQDPVQVGCMGAQATPHAMLADAFGCLTNMLNYVSINFDPEGRLYLAFTDACDPRNDCLHDFSSGFQARDRNLAVAAQMRGTSMINTDLDAWDWSPPAVSTRHAPPEDP